MPIQTFPNLEFSTHDLKLTLSLHINNMDTIKNHINNNSLKYYLENNFLINQNDYSEENIVISDYFIMIDLRGNNFIYKNNNYRDIFKDVFVNNKFLRSGVFPIFLIKDMYAQNSNDFDYISHNMQLMAYEIINNIM